MIDRPPPFSVEVAIRAPRDAVWRALTEPDEIRRWFGWDYDGLDAEIEFIFVAHADPQPPGRIVLELDQVIELETRGEQTVVRAVSPGPRAGDDAWSEIGQGWRMFLEQLRFQLERHPGAARRTIAFRGEAVPALVARAVAARVPGELRFEGAHVRAVAGLDGTLATLIAEGGLGSQAPGTVGVVVSTYDLPGEDFAAAERAWTTWWEALAAQPDGPPD